MLKTEFNFDTIVVKARAESINGFSVNGLLIRFIDYDGNKADYYPDERTMNEIEEMATEYLIDNEFVKELEF